MKPVFKLDRLWRALLAIAVFLLLAYLFFKWVEQKAAGYLAAGKSELIAAIPGYTLYQNLKAWWAKRAAPSIRDPNWFNPDDDLWWENTPEQPAPVTAPFWGNDSPNPADPFGLYNTGSGHWL